jgi:succinylglutamic semialdehyde dehydrogenase
MILQSTNPANGAIIWEGPVDGPEHCAQALERARAASPLWARTPLEERLGVARRFAALLKEQSEPFAQLIAQETGKQLWDSRGEVNAMIGKVEISIAAQAERAGSREQAMPFGRSVLRHRPHGVMAVLGPYNFPGHLPNGHIVPALIAGNVVVFKPSEETPAVGARMAELWAKLACPMACSRSCRAAVTPARRWSRAISTACSSPDRRRPGACSAALLPTARMSFWRWNWAATIR